MVSVPRVCDIGKMSTPVEVSKPVELHEQEKIQVELARDARERAALYGPEGCQVCPPLRATLPISPSGGTYANQACHGV